MNNIGKFLKNVIAITLTTPVLLYIIFISKNSIIMCMKFGWHSRPYTYIDLKNILVYIIYNIVILFMLLLFWAFNRDYKIFLWCSSILFISIFAYWFQLLSFCITTL